MEVYYVLREDTLLGFNQSLKVKCMRGLDLFNGMHTFNHALKVKDRRGLD